MTAVEIINAVAEHWLLVVVIVMFTCWAVVEMVRVVAKNWRRIAEARYQAAVLENEAKLKALMLQRGMPPEEIARVLASGSGSMKADDAGSGQLEKMLLEHGIEADEIKRALHGSGESGSHETEIVEKLVEAGYEADDIAGILTAARINSQIEADAVRLVKVMADNEMDSDDMERVLRARRSGKVVSIDVAAALKGAGVGNTKIDRVIRAVQGDDQAGPDAPTRSA